MASKPSTPSRSISQHSMSEEHREFLRKNREYLKKNLNVEYVWPHMTDVLEKNDEDMIRLGEPTRHRKIVKLLDLLPLRGANAFNAFIIATYKTQKWLGEELAEKAGINLNAILPNAEDSPGMKDIHSKILKKHLPEFNRKLDVEKMVESLVKAEIITEHNPGLGQAVSEVLEEPTKKKQVEKLICDVLPQLGPMAFDSFFTALKFNQPQFAHDLKQLINQSHPGVFLDQGKCTQESTNVATPANQKCALSTPCSELPEEVFRPLEERLNKLDEVLENDWKRFYKVLKLPEKKENVIAEKSDNPTRYVMNVWIARDGKQATVKKLLEALSECGQGGLAHTIEKLLGVELKLECDVVDAVRNMHVEEPKRNKAIRIVKDIPGDLRAEFIDRLDGLKEVVLSDILTDVNMRTCPVRDAEDFLEKMGEHKTRILFRELRKREQSEIVAQWMREKFPAGSTGPMKSDDELSAGEMNYGHRCEITKILTGNGSWESLVSHRDINMKANHIAYLKKITKDPGESVLSSWEVSTKSTAGTMYDLLVDCGLNEVADHL